MQTLPPLSLSLQPARFSPSTMGWAKVVWLKGSMPTILCTYFCNVSTTEPRKAKASRLNCSHSCSPPLNNVTGVCMCVCVYSEKGAFPCPVSASVDMVCCWRKLNGTHCCERTLACKMKPSRTVPRFGTEGPKRDKRGEAGPYAGVCECICIHFPIHPRVRARNALGQCRLRAVFLSVGK